MGCKLLRRSGGQAEGKDRLLEKARGLLSTKRVLQGSHGGMQNENGVKSLQLRKRHKGYARACAKVSHQEKGVLVSWGNFQYSPSNELSCDIFLTVECCRQYTSKKTRQ